MGYSAKEIVRNTLALGAGVVTTLSIIGLFQISSPHVFDPLQRHNPIRFFELTEEFRPIQIKNEIWGLIIGIFIGTATTTLLWKIKQKLYILSLPILVVLIITIALWPFTINKELIWLALPVWIAITLSAYYFIHTIKKKLAKKRKV